MSSRTTAVILCLAVAAQLGAIFFNALHSYKVENMLSKEMQESATFQEYTRASIKAQWDRSTNAITDRNDRFDALNRKLDAKSSDRITRTEIETWRNEMNRSRPTPAVPKINSPAEPTPSPQG